MILETLRAVTDALNNETYGVNAQLAAIPVDAGDSVPSASLTAYDSTRTDKVAWGDYPDAPCIIVMQDGDVDLEGEVLTYEREADVTVLVALLMNDSDSAAAMRDGYYIMRAIVKALKQFNDPANAADRTRNGILVRDCTAIRQVAPWTTAADIPVTTGLLVSFKVEDTQT